MAAVSAGQPSSGEFRSANPQGDAFRPLLELGRGGMARVYLAEKTTRGLRRLVVLKILEPTLATDPEMRALFRREAEVCARLHHPNIVQVFEVVDEAASPFMVMEYVEGVSLSQVMARTEQRLPARLHLHVLLQVLAALHYFHELKDEEGNPLHGVHRDVSPQNVLVMHEGAVKVLDFGIAKVRDTSGAETTRAGVIKGKLSYMPPEQLVGDASIDRRADVFAVGVMLWEALARRRLWEGVDQATMMKSLMSGNIPSIRETCPWVSKTLESVVARATAVRREERFASALEMQLALEDALRELGGAVQQREVAAFMEGEFGEWRRDRQRSVDAEVRKPALPLDTVLEVDEIEEIHIESEGSLAQGHVSSRVEAAPRRRRWLVPLLGAALVAAASVSVWRNLAERAAVAARPLEAGAAVNLQIVASPLEAEITLDGQIVKENPYRGKLPFSARRVLVKAQAPGFEAETRPITLDHDAELTFRLKPLPVDADASPGSATRESERARDASATTSRKPRVPSRQPKVATPPPRVAPSVAPAPARNCSPPYVLDADGVKTYKPECL